MGLQMPQMFPPDFVFTSECPHYSLALFSSLNCFQKDPPLLYEEICNYANVAEMVKTMSIMSLLHHEGCRNKSLCNSLFAFMFPFCNRCCHSPCFHCHRDP